jgi:hypothetical protein
LHEESSLKVQPKIRLDLMMVTDQNDEMATKNKMAAWTLKSYTHLYSIYEGNLTLSGFRRGSLSFQMDAYFPLGDKCDFIALMSEE